MRKLLGPHDVITVTWLGWAGLKNGELLQAAEKEGFDVFLTSDQTLSHEQNLSGRRPAIVALSAIQLPIIRENLATITPQSKTPRPVPSDGRVWHGKSQKADGWVVSRFRGQLSISI